MARTEGDTTWRLDDPLLVSFFPPSSPSSMFNLLICIILKIIDCCTILGNYSLLFVTKLQRISHFKFEFFLPSSNLPKKNMKVGPIIRIILVPPLSSVNLRRERSQRGSGLGGLSPLSQKPIPLEPSNEMTLSTGVYGEPPVWVPVSPRPRWRPLILKRLATPQLMRQIKTSLSLNMDIRDNYYLDLLYSWSIYFTSPVNH